MIHSHSGWLDSTTQEGFDIADEWPLDDNDCCWEVGQYLLEGKYTRGKEPDGQEGHSAFWNPMSEWPSDPSYLWVMNEGAIIETLKPIDINEARPWLFVQFFSCATQILSMFDRWLNLKQHCRILTSCYAKAFRTPPSPFITSLWTSFGSWAGVLFPDADHFVLTRISV